jgi:hypothetical protein
MTDSYGDGKSGPQLMQLHDVTQPAMAQSQQLARHHDRAIRKNDVDDYISVQTRCHGGDCRNSRCHQKGGDPNHLSVVGRQIQRLAYPHGIVGDFFRISSCQTNVSVVLPIS